MSGRDDLGQLKAAMQAFGLALPRGGIRADGEIHRCADSRHHRARNDAGWYAVHVLPGGLVVAAFGSWLDGRSTKWNSRGEAVARLSSADREAVGDQQRRVEAARAARARKVERETQRIWASAKPCSSHPYLADKRVPSYGLRVDAGELLIPVSDMSGHLRSRQAIAADGKKLWPYGTDRSTALQFTIGDLKAGVAVIVVVEGYATGATIHEATGLPVVVAFDANGLKRIAKPLRAAFPAALLIFAGDHDRRDKGSTGQNAARFAAELTGDSAVLCPPIEDTDWNDHAVGKVKDGQRICEAHGLDDVRQRFATLTDPPPSPPSGLPLEEARQRLRDLTRDTVSSMMAASWSRWLDTSPPAALIAASLGLGKTHEALVVALDMIGRGVVPIVVATPTHDLNRELLKRARDTAGALGITVRIEMRLGREAIDPEGDGTAAMCLDIEAVRDVTDAGLDAQSYVCERKLKGGQVARCRFFDSCAFQKQRAKTADLWLVTHAALGHTRPTEIGHPELLIVDENPIGALLRGAEELPTAWITLGMADLAPVVLNGAGNIDKVRTAALEADYPGLVAVRRKLSAVREANGPGGIRRESLDGVQADELRQAADQAESRFFRPPDIVPGMSAYQRRELLKPAARNKTRLREGKMYDLLADFIERDDQAATSGHVSIATFKDTKGNSHEVWRLRYLGTVKKGWQAPTLLLDATARPDYRPITRQAFPCLRDDLGGQVRAATPHLRVTVVKGINMSLKAIGADDPTLKASKATLNKKLEKRAHEAATFTATKARELGGRALAIGNKALMDEIKKARPHKVETAHFNALRGRDEWRTARLQVTFGRPMPSPQAVETMAGAITGSAVLPLDDWYERTTRPLIVGGKVVGAVHGVRHPDPMTEAVRWSICEGEILQSERMRAVERTADTPADWFLVGCEIPDDLVVDAVEAWEAPTPVEEMLAADGVALLSAPAAARAYPSLWSTLDAAKKALQRDAERLGTFPYSYSYRGMSLTSPATFAYRLAGPGQRPAVALVNLDAVPDPRAWLESRLGPLAYFEGDDGPEAPPPAVSMPVPEIPAPVVDLPAAAPAEPAGQFLESIKGGDLAVAGFSAQYAREGGGFADNSEVSAALKATAAFAKVDASSEWPTPSLRLEASGPGAFSHQYARAREADPWADYAGGIVPVPARDQVRDRWRASGLTQDQVAQRAGISRPQFSNAMQGTYGLSPAAAARLRAVVASLPVVQAALW